MSQLRRVLPLMAAARATTRSTAARRLTSASASASAARFLLAPSSPSLIPLRALHCTARRFNNDAPSAASASASTPTPAQPSSQQQCKQQEQQQQQQQQQQKSGGGSSWSSRIGVAFFLSTAAFAVYLGQWQVKRRAWKQDLIERRTAALDAPPMPLESFLSSRASADSSSPSSSHSSSDADECRRVVVRGVLHSDRALLLGPRSPPSTDGSSTAGQGIGFYLVTPMVTREGRTLLVNQGWVPKAALPLPSDQTEVEVVGVIRKGEPRPQYLSNYDPLAAGSFIFLDLPLMARVAGISPASPSSASPTAAAPSSPDSESVVPLDSRGQPVVLLDALDVTPSPSRLLKRRTVNDYLHFTTTPTIHLVYATTWFTLATALVALTWIRFRKRAPPTLQRTVQQKLK